MVKTTTRLHTVNYAQIIWCHINSRVSQMAVEWLSMQQTSSEESKTNPIVLFMKEIGTSQN